MKIQVLITRIKLFNFQIWLEIIHEPLFLDSHVLRDAW